MANKVHDIKMKNSRVYNLFKNDNFSFENGFYSKYAFDRLKLIEINIIICYLIILIASLAYYEIYNSVDLNYEQKELIFYIIILFSGLIILLFFLRIYFYIKYLQIRNTVNYLDLYLNLLFQIILSLLIPYQKLEGFKFLQYNLIHKKYYFIKYNSLFVLIVLIRIFFLINILLSFSKYSNNRMQRINYLQGNNHNSYFIFKCLLKENPLKTIFISLIIISIIFAFLIRIVETPLFLIVPEDEVKFNLSNYYNCLWLVFVTMTTIGFGDYYALTLYGKFFTVILSFFGIILISVMVVTLTSMVEWDNREIKSLYMYDKLELYSRMENESSILITNYFILFFHLKKKKEKYNKYFVNKILEKIKKHNLEFKIIKKKFLTLEDNNDLNIEFNDNIEKILEEIKSINFVNRNLIESNKQYINKLENK